VTHLQAREIHHALTKGVNYELPETLLWGIFRLLSEIGGDDLYQKIVGKPITEAVDYEPPKDKPTTAVPGTPTIPIRTNPTLGPVKPG